MSSFSIFDQYKGEFFALAAGLFWSCTVILWRIAGLKIDPLKLVWISTGFALVLFGAACMVLGIPFFPELSGSDWGRLLFSGFCGIVLGDLLVVSGLKRIGAGLEAIVSCSYPPLVAVIGFVFFGEMLSAQGILGAVLALTGISLATVSEPIGNAPIQNTTRIAGILMSFLGHASYAIGGLMIRDIYTQHSIFWTNGVRFLVAFVCFSVFLFYSGFKNKTSVKPLSAESPFSRGILFILLGSFFGPFLSTCFWFLGFVHTLVAKAAILNQMSAIYIVIAAALFLKEPLTRKRVLALILALSGAVLVTLDHS